MDEHGRDFTKRLHEIESADRAALKSTLDNLDTKDPAAEQFWILSRQIRLVSESERRDQDLKPLLGQIYKVVKEHRNEKLSAAFANAHLLRAAHFIGQNDCYKWARELHFAENPLFAAQLYNVVALPNFSNVLTEKVGPLYSLLDMNHVLIQKNAAAAIARTAKKPGNMLRRILSTFSETPTADVQKLDLPVCQSDRSSQIRLRGFLFVIEYLMNNPVPVAEYMNLFIPILSSPATSPLEKAISIHVQTILSKLMVRCPAAFHLSQGTIIGFVVKLYENKTLQQEFLRAILKTFGISAVRRLASAMLERWIGSASCFQFIQVLVPYAMFLNCDDQIELQRTLVERCKKRPLDESLWEMTARVMMVSSPTVSPYVGEFMEMAEKSVFSQEILYMMKTVMEPKTQPVMHPMRDLVKVKEIEKKDMFTQVHPDNKSVIVQCDRTREIVAKPPPKTRTVVPAKKITTVTKVEPVEAVPDIDLGALDFDLDLEAHPDSDED